MQKNYIQIGDKYRVEVDFILKCKRCGCPYHFKTESIQPSKEHIDKFIEYHMIKFKNNPYNFAHICDVIPDQMVMVGKLNDLNHFENNLYANYGMPEMIGFDISVNKELGEG